MTTTDITAQILRDIRDEVRHGREEARAESRGLSHRIDALRTEVVSRLDVTVDRIDHLTVEVAELKSEVTELKAEVRDFKVEMRHFQSTTDANFAGVLMIQGTQKVELDQRVSRIEQHLGLTR